MASTDGTDWDAAFYAAANLSPERAAELMPLVDALTGASGQEGPIDVEELTAKFNSLPPADQEEIRALVHRLYPDA